MDDPLLKYCLNNSNKRFWWFRTNRHLPVCYEVLAPEERLHMVNFFELSEREGGKIGDCNVPCISLVMTLLLCNRIQASVALGHSHGFSTILMGMCMRKKGLRSSLYSIDIDPRLTDFARERVGECGLNDYVHLQCADSADAAQVAAASRYFSGRPADLIFIDTSHAFDQTMRELELWFPTLRVGGFILLHDCSEKAQLYDPAGRGVIEAIREFTAAHGVDDRIAINRTVKATHTKQDLVYSDGCGLAILQKSF